MSRAGERSEGERAGCLLFVIGKLLLLVVEVIDVVVAVVVIVVVFVVASAAVAVTFFLHFVLTLVAIQ